MANVIIPPSVPVINFAWIGTNPRFAIHQLPMPGLRDHHLRYASRPAGVGAPTPKSSAAIANAAGGLAIVPKHAPKGWTA